MGIFDRLFGTEPSEPRPRPKRAAPPSSDAQALERYRYMLQTAPPETIEQAHEEAFAKLNPEQRRQVLSELARTAPANESAAIAATSVDDTRALARVATRAEIRQPGTMERSLGGAGMGLGASLLSSFAMGFLGSMVANSFFSAMGGGFDTAMHEGDPAAGDGQTDDTQQADYQHEDNDPGGDGYDDGDGGDFGGGDDFA